MKISQNKKIEKRNPLTIVFFIIIKNFLLDFYLQLHIILHISRKKSVWLILITIFYLTSKLNFSKRCKNNSYIRQNVLRTY